MTHRQHLVLGMFDVIDVSNQLLEDLVSAKHHGSLSRVTDQRGQSAFIKGSYSLFLDDCFETIDDSLVFGLVDALVDESELDHIEGLHHPHLQPP